MAENWTVLIPSARLTCYVVSEMAKKGFIIDYTCLGCGRRHKSASCKICGSLSYMINLDKDYLDDAWRKSLPVSQRINHAPQLSLFAT